MFRHSSADHGNRFVAQLQKGYHHQQVSILENRLLGIARSYSSPVSWYRCSNSCADLAAGFRARHSGGRWRARLYRLVELVGRWSMLDIYVVTLLAALVHIGSLATVKAGSGALAFGAVVVLTMFAAFKFDPRLIWDPLRKGNRR
jgi:hypothetical protein